MNGCEYKASLSVCVCISILTYLLDLVFSLSSPLSPSSSSHELKSTAQGNHMINYSITMLPLQINMVQHPVG